ncbi:hypothetical protein OBBRIDRAFT_443128 [Obba rivulosa]|uniref:Uncharacterized protein n=1 Tax=Obba rivulosa TaxID=1052685 RepID=A0A8E2J6G3_9APHY|nr:hypothetical protein OBBRIDRAFT_443128 [Obba rivulosa]
MGQRHQVFVIARIRPHGSLHNAEPKYRCIAALHRQWCYGRDPLEAMRRFLTLVKQPENAEMIRAEIRSIHGQYGHPGTAHSPKIVDIPCPFIGALLSFAWNVDLTPGKCTLSGSWPDSLLWASMGSWDGDNNDGISVVDVTDPNNPAFGFLLSKSAILTPAGYLRKYEKIPSDEELKHEWDQLRRQYDLDPIAALRDERMITMQMLAEAWPHEYTETMRASNADTIQVSVEQTLEEKPCKVPSLAHMALEQALVYALQCGDTTALEKFVWLPDRSNILLSLLRKQSPFPDSAITLLSKIIRELRTGTASLDLSELSLSADQTRQLVLVPAFAGLHALNMSFNPYITVDAVHHLLAGIPSLRRLLIMGCPHIDSKDLCRLMRCKPALFRRLEALMHPLLLEPYKPPCFPDAFTLIFSNDRGRSTEVQNISLPLFTPAGIVDGLADMVYAVFQQYFFDDHKSCIAGQATLSSLVPPDKEWEERTLTTIPSPPRSGPQELRTQWSFVFEHSPDVPDEQRCCRWAFVRMKTSADLGNAPADAVTIPDDEVLDESMGTHSRDPHPDFDILDVRGFIRAMVEEGRDLPSKAAIIRLKQALSEIWRVTVPNDDVDIQEDMVEDDDEEGDDGEEDDEEEDDDGDEDEGEDQDLQTFIMTRERVEELLGRTGSIRRRYYFGGMRSFAGGHNCTVVHP